MPPIQFAFLWKKVYYFIVLPALYVVKTLTIYKDEMFNLFAFCIEIGINLKFENTFVVCSLRVLLQEGPEVVLLDGGVLRPEPHRAQGVLHRYHPYSRT